MTNLDALILGIVEGLTEFLPVSSTGHMILTTSILKLDLDHFLRSFLIIIQLGSILAVVFVFYEKLFKNFKIWLKLGVSFFPTGVLGLFLAKHLDALFNGYVVVFMLIFGGLVFILIELFYKNQAKTTSISKVSYKQAFLIGLFQALAMIPGTSRSGSSIIGALFLGLNRKTAAEFSFLLALPTMFIASIYSLYKEPELLNVNAYEPLIIGFVTAFVVAVLVIKLFLKFISKFSFLSFGIYRIILGLVFFYIYYNGILSPGSDFKI